MSSQVISHISHPSAGRTFWNVFKRDTDDWSVSRQALGLWRLCVSECKHASWEKAQREAIGCSGYLVMSLDSVWLTLRFHEISWDFALSIWKTSLVALVGTFQLGRASSAVVINVWDALPRCASPQGWFLHYLDHGSFFRVACCPNLRHNPISSDIIRYHPISPDIIRYHPISRGNGDVKGSGPCPTLHASNLHHHKADTNLWGCDSAVDLQPARLMYVWCSLMAIYGYRKAYRTARQRSGPEAIQWHSQAKDGKRWQTPRTEQDFNKISKVSFPNGPCQNCDGKKARHGKSWQGLGSIVHGLRAVNAARALPEYTAASPSNM